MKNTVKTNCKGKRIVGKENKGIHVEKNNSFLKIKMIKERKEKKEKKNGRRRKKKEKEGKRGKLHRTEKPTLEV